MDNQKFENIGEVIQRFILRKSSSDDEKMLYEWIKDNPENRKRLFQEKDLWDSSQLGTSKLIEAEREQWQQLQKSIASSKMHSLNVGSILRIAAIVVISLGVRWFGRYLYTQETFLNQTGEMKSVEAGKGQLKEIFLADGTHVWLNSDSELLFPSLFDANNRKVELIGEAYFEVTANEEKPFFVKTRNHTVKVVGTKFNICEYPESHIIETTLEKGKVKIISGNFIHDLLPGEQSSFNTETSEVRIGNADIDVYTAWKDGKYDFNNVPVSKVFQIIERWWDVKISYPEELKNERISGVLRRYKPLKQHFEIIQQLIPFELRINNDNITIKLKR